MKLFLSCKESEKCKFKKTKCHSGVKIRIKQLVTIKRGNWE